MEQWKARFKDEKHNVDAIIENRFSKDNITHSLIMRIGETTFNGMEFADFE
ncbi:hypothetical protein [Fusobacterium sp. PH5-44]|uniref:hypothetical protein n=1 Tax=unclassified Fusobacterium TaxID=2648384 RepID=UPI003D24775F